MTAANSRPFLGTTEDPDQAFPGIKEMTVTVAQDPYGYYRKTDTQPINRYTKYSLPRRERCLNPRCQQGGLDLQQIVTFSGDGEHQFSCNGHEGTQQGRRKGDPCDNVFVVTITTTR
ncbi:hypothetical protein [Ralstonia solanacearum]|uniref:hypothetical protein n=1 Tax=Ralstonia solanacearum TaxID=305 RepID=UPI001FFA30C9